MREQQERIQFLEAQQKQLEEDEMRAKAENKREMLQKSFEERRLRQQERRREIEEAAQRIADLERKLAESPPIYIRNQMQREALEEAERKEALERNRNKNARSIAELQLDDFESEYLKKKRELFEQSRHNAPPVDPNASEIRRFEALRTRKMAERVKNNVESAKQLQRDYQLEHAKKRQQRQLQYGKMVVETYVKAAHDDGRPLSLGPPQHPSPFRPAGSPPRRLPESKLSDALLASQKAALMSDIPPEVREFHQQIRGRYHESLQALERDRSQPLWRSPIREEEVDEERLEEVRRMRAFREEQDLYMAKRRALHEQRVARLKSQLDNERVALRRAVSRGDAQATPEEAARLHQSIRQIEEKLYRMENQSRNRAASGSPSRHRRMNDIVAEEVQMSSALIDVINGKLSLLNADLPSSGNSGDSSKPSQLGVIPVTPVAAPKTPSMESVSSAYGRIVYMNESNIDGEDAAEAAAARAMAEKVMAEVDDFILNEKGSGSNLARDRLKSGRRH